MEKTFKCKVDKDDIKERNDRILDLSDAQTFEDQYHFGEATWKNGPLNPTLPFLNNGYLENTQHTCTEY